MVTKDLIDIAYDAVANYLNKSKNDNATVTFNKICDLTRTAAKLTEVEFKETIGSFYVDLLQDNRFVFLGDNTWNLKDRISNEVYKKNINSLYDDSKESLIDEDFNEKVIIKDEDYDSQDERDDEYSDDSDEDEEYSDDDIESEEDEDNDIEEEFIKETIQKKKKNKQEDDEY